MKRWFFTEIAIFLSVMSVSAEMVRVTGNNVNLRAAPVADSEVVFQVMEGEKLESAGIEGAWVKIVPPEKASLWVYGDFVKDGVVVVSRLRVRAGQGANYKTVGYLEKGTKLKVRGTEGDWLKVAPPKGAYLWISSDYVSEIKDKPKPPPEKKEPAPVKKQPHSMKPTQVPKKPAVKQPVKKPPLPEVTVPVVKTPTQPIKVIPSLPSSGERYVLKKDEISEDMAKVLTRLRPAEGKGRIVQYKGTLRKSSLVWRRPSKYRLIMNDERGRAFTICYVLGTERRLKKYEGRLILVYGREYWVEGVRYSVVVPEQLVTRD